ncbi:hypothetical protein A2X44_02555 [candidate division CPR3 bacterium GWF2_35_18]|uniref:CMP/dCMP-type deaminase domain-containing protein n=1 Tax=candidate division CPR3 bacterium GW2011_GWF2_35_18 TaxID=1618350 RepID=A0A0G0E243_UNCC3|nr:MAG: hypothetical protein UR67_C0008G0001 [candidate division CPR3 bacterium GW2011_GWF2_35_18]KKP85575.1 MAG: hypothetical protein UR87_C0044G0002 [candidate division CPR3 bacterium GW2011_GWE2_35_7]OGB62473.1 MAG: hypothetical protein A2X44_02555 [candidate division CPR3 bacterium GWF2_35_18]OGB65517.1 MAG: hypothetical protein A2250_04135 [candidate division CPR3 bacterium RIFOXYA2_FULL_35_13]OGB75785.1 MAG: hypothetical protein A2476_01535 [candidate division CPR3 bacterium RIFOXYC2_FULL
MKKIGKNKQSFDLYELTESECKNLFAKQQACLKNTYPHKGKGGYSSAVMTVLGHIYEGASYESDTQSLTMHGEAVAFTHANLHGESEVIAITGPNCHICKQLIWESSLRSKIDIIVVIREEGKIKQIPISDLMPYPWPEIK